MSSQQKAEVVDREATALELAKAGYTFREIGDHLGMTGSGAFKAFQRAMRKTIQLPADEYRDLHRERLESIFKTHYPAMRRGDMAATDRCLKALASLADLMGINAPSKVNVSVVVQQAADEFGLTADERAILETDVQAFITSQKVVPA